MKELIAILDDEPDIIELISLNLKKNGYRVKDYEKADSFFRALTTEIPDMLLLDLMLPDMDGMEVCKRLRSDPRTSGMPVIMITARHGETDKIVGLELGADDYVTKPFSPSELMARVKAVLRRSKTKSESKFLSIDNILEMDLQKHEVLVNKKQVPLTLTEFRILELLAGQRSRVFSRDQMLDQVWGEDKVVFDRTIDVHIKNLRDKLGPAGKLIKNIRGLGYKLA
jgi:DNA-binding response OmpR family regulator